MVSAMNLGIWVVSLGVIITSYQHAGVRLFELSDTGHTLLGWVDPTDARRLVLQLYLTFVVDLGGTMGYISSMKYFDPLIVSVVMILEPIIATLEGMLVGDASMPGLWGLFGAGLVIVGSGVVVMSSAKHEDTVTTSIGTASGDASPFGSPKLRPGIRGQLQPPPDDLDLKV